MRKVSKSRTDDDVISSTNGSVTNDVEEQDNGVAEAKDDAASQDELVTDADTGNDKTDDTEDEPVKTASKRKVGRGRPKKKTSKSKDSVNDSNEDSNEKDDDSGHGDENQSEANDEPPKKRGRPKSKKSAKTADNNDDGDDDDEEEYEVEKIIDSKKIKNKLHYLIRWKGYSASSDSWEPASTVSCADLISKFNEEKAQSKSNGSKKAKNTKSKSKSGKGSKSPTKRAKTEWDSENADENAEYEVERILEVHHKKNGDREFLVHWKGWSNKFDSWEPEENLNCSELIKKFMGKVKSARSSDSKSLRVAPESTHRFTLQAPSTGRRLSKRRGQRQRIRYDNAE